MPLLSLPSEILALISNNLDWKDLNSFCRTNRSFKAFLSYYLYRRVDPNVLLAWAVLKGRETTLKVALEMGADVALADCKGKTPLHQAAALPGGVETCRILLEAGADVSARDKYDNQPIHMATIHKNHATISVLVENGASFGHHQNHGQTPLIIAVMNRCNTTVEHLLDLGASTATTDKRRNTALSWAAAKGDEHIVRTLVERGADIESRNLWGRTPLVWAVIKGHEAVVAFLLDSGADISSLEISDHKSHPHKPSGETVLHRAAELGHEGVCKIILERGVDVSAVTYHRNELDEVTKNDHTQAHKTRTEPFPMSRGVTALHLAAKNGHVGIVELLLEAGADITAVKNDAGLAAFETKRRNRDKKITLVGGPVAKILCPRLGVSGAISHG